MTMAAKSYLCGTLNKIQTMIEVTDVALRQAAGEGRSEERRVGKECRL